MNVRKYNGRSEPFDPTKIKGWVNYALSGALPPEEVDSIVNSIVPYEGITTSDIQLKLVNICTNRALVGNAAAYLEAARILYLTTVHKPFYKVFPSLEKYTGKVSVEQFLRPVIEFGVAEGIYEHSLLDFINTVDCSNMYVDVSRDNLIPACGLIQLVAKYFRTIHYGNELVYRETPTVMYGLMALTARSALYALERKTAQSGQVGLLGQEGEDQDFTEIYDNLSTGKNNSPTPMTIGLRTPQQEYASCVLAEVPDTMTGIDTMYDIVSKATAARAGLGVQPSAIRPLLAPVKNGSLKHTGLVKFIQAWMKITKATVQNSARGGSATFNIAYWHRNYFDLVMLNDADGEETVRCKEADYVFHHDGYLLQAALDDRYIALLDPNTDMGNGLSAYDTYYSNIEYFYQWVWDNVDSLPTIEDAKPYENCKVKAYAILERLARQIFKTGNNYQFFTDNVNEHTPYEEPIKMTNLCVHGDTTILIKGRGLVPIKDVAGTVQTVWNGFEWSENTKVMKTGENQKLLKVTTELGRQLFCTDYHKWYVTSSTSVFGDKDSHTELRTKDLKVGDKLMEFAAPVSNTLVVDTVSSVEELPGEYDTYCVTEPIRNLCMFNGIVTGQCVEVLEPTHPVEQGDPFSEVALCTLGGIPWGYVEDSEIPKVCRGQLKLLAAVFEKSKTRIPFTDLAKERRSIGIGAIDVHHYLAKFNLDLTDGSIENLMKVGKIVHDRMELIQYHLIREAAILARQYGPADYKTKWKKGWLPIDTYKRHPLTSHPLNLDWEGLREFVVDSGGLYFSALSAHMPSESSSVIWGFVNSFEPPRDEITDKSSKVLSVLVPVPEIGKLKYTMAYDVHPDIQLVIAANIQKFSCQGMSYNTYIDYSKKKTFTMDEAMERLFYKPWALGLKTSYYTNFNIENDGERIEIVDRGCESGACTI